MLLSWNKANDTPYLRQTKYKARKSKTATSSTEAEFLAAVTAAKHAKYLRAVLLEIGYPQDGPTPLYEVNMSAISMINTH